MELSKNPLVKLQCKLGWHNTTGHLTEEEAKGILLMITDHDLDPLVGFFLCSAMYCSGCGKVTELSLQTILRQVNRHLKQHDINEKN